MKSQLEDIKILQSYRGKEIECEIIQKIEQCFGNLDEGETWNIKETALSVRFLLENVYSAKGYYSQDYDKLKYISALLEGKEVLVPFKYSYVPELYLRNSCTTIIDLVKEIKTPDGLVVGIEPRGVSNTFDGYQSALPDLEKYSEKDMGEYRKNKYPLLWKEGCVYNNNSKCIKGQIENLLKECSPLW